MNSNQYQYQVARDRFGLQVAARLSDAADELSYDISARLRAARVRALGQRKIAVMPKTANLAASGTLTLGNEQFGWWNRFATALALVTLVLGLIAIHDIQNDKRTSELAEIDAALLTDALPPAAYTDPVFVQFLKMRAGQNQ